MACRFRCAAPCLVRVVFIPKWPIPTNSGSRPVRRKIFTNGQDERPALFETRSTSNCGGLKKSQTSTNRRSRTPLASRAEWTLSRSRFVPLTVALTSVGSLFVGGHGSCLVRCCPKWLHTCLYDVTCTPVHAPSLPHYRPGWVRRQHVSGWVRSAQASGHERER